MTEGNGVHEGLATDMRLSEQEEQLLKTLEALLVCRLEAVRVCRRAFLDLVPENRIHILRQDGSEVTASEIREAVSVMWVEHEAGNPQRWLARRLRIEPIQVPLVISNMLEAGSAAMAMP